MGIEYSIEIDLPIRTAYEQWLRFEPRAASAPDAPPVDQLSDRDLHWFAKIGGVAREWDPCAMCGPTAAGAEPGTVRFYPLAVDLTRVSLRVESPARGLTSSAALKECARRRLEQFREFVDCVPAGC